MLLGELGCGKSALIDILGGLDRGSDVQVIVKGVDIAHASDDVLNGYLRVRVVFLF